MLMQLQITSLSVHLWLLLIGPGNWLRFGGIAWILAACHACLVKQILKNKKLTL